MNIIPTAPFLITPEVSSEQREYVPIGWLKPLTIPSNLVRVLENVSLADFELLTSAMHMAWLQYIGGRLESRYHYSIGLVYNTFSMPPAGANLSKLAIGASCAQCSRQPPECDIGHWPTATVPT